MSTSIIEDRIGDTAESRAKNELDEISRDFVRKIEAWRIRHGGSGLAYDNFKIIGLAPNDFSRSIREERMGNDRIRIRETSVHRFTERLQKLIAKEEK